MLKKISALVVVFIMMTSVMVTAANDDGDPLGFDDYNKHDLSMTASATTSQAVYAVDVEEVDVKVTGLHNGHGDPGDNKNKDVLVVIYEGDTILGSNTGLTIAAVDKIHIGVGGEISFTHKYDFEPVQPGETVNLTVKIYDYGNFSGWKSMLIGSASVSFSKEQQFFTISATSNPVSGPNATFEGLGTVENGKHTVTLTGYDQANYIFTGWSDGYESLSRPAFVEGADVELVANFTEIPPIPTTYAVRVSSNMPGALATFSGYGTGFADGQSYNVSLASYDMTNYRFIGFSQPEAGSINGSDVELIANFEEIIIDEPAPEEPIIIEPEEPTIIEPEEPIIIEPEEEPIPEEIIVEEEILDDVIPEDIPIALPETSGIPFDILGGSEFLLILSGLFLKKK